MAEYKSNEGKYPPSLVGEQPAQEKQGAQDAAAIIQTFRNDEHREPTPTELAEISAAVLQGVVDPKTIKSVLDHGDSFISQGRLPQEPQVTVGTARVIPTNVRLNIVKSTGADISDTALHDLGQGIRTPDQVIGAAETRLISPIPTELGTPRVVPPYATRRSPLPPQRESVRSHKR